MIPSEPSNFYRNHFHFEFSMEVSVLNISGCINYVPEYFVLESSEIFMILSKFDHICWCCNTDLLCSGGPTTVLTICCTDACGRTHQTLRPLCHNKQLQNSVTYSDADVGVFAAVAPHTALTPLPGSPKYGPPPLQSLAKNFRTLKCWVCLWAGHVAHVAAMRIT